MYGIAEQTLTEYSPNVEKIVNFNKLDKLKVEIVFFLLRYKDSSSPIFISQGVLLSLLYLLSLYFSKLFYLIFLGNQ